ncbi:MAG: branched-chain amino acid ABC transporter permease [Alphaproteobacteria bacterium]|nr:branched-chain amino acid ABC transporter permease [Alphaproteobacteria bacterium]
MHQAPAINRAAEVRLFRRGADAIPYAGLAALAVLAPVYLDDYGLAQVGLALVYAIAGLGVVLLTGYAGQVSLGHAAFLASGAYAEAVLLAHGVPFVVALPAAGALAALLGIIVGLPALRLSGIYLTVATLALAFIAEEVLARWEPVTGGNSGLVVTAPTMLGWELGDERALYYMALALFSLALIGSANLVRSPLGRALIAVRDSEVAASALGVDLARTKLTVFAFSAGLTGVAGALYAHKIAFISPEQFTITASIELLLIAFIGGPGALAGALLGAGFLIGVPQIVALARPLLPPAIATQNSIEAAVFGIALILFIRFEPRGLHGLWLRARASGERIARRRRHVAHGERPGREAP